MINTQIMFFRQEKSKKYGKYISTAKQNGMVYSIPKDKEQLSGYLEVVGCTEISPNFALADVRPLNTDILTREDTQKIASELMCTTSECSLYDSRLLCVNNERIVFKRNGEFYVADGHMPNTVSLADIDKYKEIQLPYDLALYIAVSKDLENATYDKHFVYANNLAYTIFNLDIVSVPDQYVPHGEETPITEDDMNQFQARNYINSRYGDKKTLKVTYDVFGTTVTVNTFSRSGMSVKEYLYGSPLRDAVISSFAELDKFKTYALKKLGMKAVNDVRALSTDRILNII